MLARGVVDTDVARILPAVTAALATLGRARPAAGIRLTRRWSPTFARRAKRGTLASAATRLNYDVAGLSHAAVHHRPAAPDELSARRARDADRHRSEVGRARDLGGDTPRRGPGHRFLPAGRARSARDADNAIVGAPAEQRVFRDVLGRTLWISGDRSRSICLLLGYPVAYVIARQPPAARGAAAVPGAAAVLDLAARAHRRVGRAAAEGRRAEQPASCRSAWCTSR